MTQYLVAIHLPDDFDPAAEAPDYREGISQLNREMVDAGIRVFVGGLGSPREAKTLRRQGGRVQIVDGPFAEAKEHVGGFWVLELPSLEAALAWGEKAAIACRAPVEVRAFH